VTNFALATNITPSTAAMAQKITVQMNQFLVPAIARPHA
jgi:hypothetical protein